MGMDYGYEKLSLAVHALAAGQGDLRERLYSAMVEMTAVNPDQDLPEGIREEYREMKRRMTQGPATEYEGTLVASEPDDLRHFANQIVRMFEETIAAWNRGR